MKIELLPLVLFATINIISAIISYPEIGIISVEWEAFIAVISFLLLAYTYLLIIFFEN